MERMSHTISIKKNYTKYKISLILTDISTVETWGGNRIVLIKTEIICLVLESVQVHHILLNNEFGHGISTGPPHFVKYCVWLHTRTGTPFY